MTTPSIDEHDVRFFKSILVGSIIGIPALMVVTTVAMALATGQSLTMAAGYSAVPALFCGPFVGGLFTSAMASRDLPLGPEHEVTASIPTTEPADDVEPVAA